MAEIPCRCGATISVSEETADGVLISQYDDRCSECIAREFER